VTQGPSQTIAGEANEESVSELFGIVQRLLEDERSPGQTLETKTSTLAGFTGAILALTAGFGRDLLRLDLGRVGDVVFAVVFAVAVAALAAGAILAVFGVLRPQERLAISRAEIRHFSQFPLIATAPMEIQGRMINTLVVAFERERQVNDRKARLTQLAALALVIGLLSVACEALTVTAVSFG
jgi:hypothetical protein